MVYPLWLLWFGFISMTNSTKIFKAQLKKMLLNNLKVMQDNDELRDVILKRLVQTSQRRCFGRTWKVLMLPLTHDGTHNQTLTKIFFFRIMKKVIKNYYYCFQILQKYYFSNKNKKIIVMQVIEIYFKDLYRSGLQCRRHHRQGCNASFASRFQPFLSKSSQQTS